MPDAKMKRAYVDIPEGTLHYLTAGDGPPLLIMHPATAGAVHFADIVPILGTKFRAMALDNFGHGYSGPPPVPSTIVDGARIIGHFLDAVGADKTYILAQHTGAGISVEFAVRNPGRVMKMVLEGSPDWDEDVRVQLRERGVGATIKEDGSHLMDVWNVRAQFAKKYSTLEMVHRATMASLQALEHGSTVHRWAEDQYLSQELPRVKCPILFLCGENDTVARFVDAHYSYVSPDVPKKKVILEGCGDYAAMEKPQEYAKNVIEFLSEG